MHTVPATKSVTKDKLSKRNPSDSFSPLHSQLSMKMWSIEK